MTKESIWGGVYENCDIGYVFNYCERTFIDMEKRMIPLDSGHQIGLDNFIGNFKCVWEWSHRSRC